MKKFSILLGLLAGIAFALQAPSNGAAEAVAMPMVDGDCIFCSEYGCPDSTHDAWEEDRVGGRTVPGHLGSSDCRARRSGRPVTRCGPVVAVVARPGSTSRRFVGMAIKHRQLLITHEQRERAVLVLMDPKLLTLVEALAHPGRNRQFLAR